MKSATQRWFGVVAANWRSSKLEMIEAILGDVDPDEDHQRACLALTTRLWKTKIRER